jgi:hypothetical protein
MNQRDRQNIKEFLSANHSQMGLNSGQVKIIEDVKNTSANPLLNDSMVSNYLGNRTSIYGMSRGSFANGTNTNQRYTQEEAEDNTAI